MHVFIHTYTHTHTYIYIYMHACIHNITLHNIALLYITFTLHLHYIYITFTLHLHYIYITFTLHLHYIYITFTLHLHLHLYYITLHIYIYNYKIVMTCYDQPLGNGSKTHWYSICGPVRRHLAFETSNMSCEGHVNHIQGAGWNTLRYSNMRWEIFNGVVSGKIHGILPIATLDCRWWNFHAASMILVPLQASQST